jgi:hypothetical protein
MLKKNLSVYLLIILLGGLFWSRALLSIIVLVWALIAIIQVVKTDRTFFKSGFFIWSICPLILWLLGAWQDPMGKSNFDYLLTLSAYPAIVLIVHSSPKKVVEKTWMNIWLIATAIALSYPLFWYFKDYAAVNQAYGTGRSLPTFMDTDHVRFSIFLCGGLLLILFSSVFTKKNKQILAAILLILILFLSVRTGWILSIIIVSIYALQLLIRSNQKKLHSILIVASFIVLLFAISYISFPTMQQKMAYSIWEWNQYRPGTYDASYSDGTRRAINIASWKCIQTNNWINTGWQGIPTALQTSFSKYFSGQTLAFGWPFNQWLYWWMGSGWWGMLLFSAWFMYPAIIGFKQKNMAIICWTIAIVLSCLVEVNLNYQYGVLLHVLPLAILWKISTTSKVDNS